MEVYKVHRLYEDRTGWFIGDNIATFEKLEDAEDYATKHKNVIVTIEFKEDLENR